MFTHKYKKTIFLLSRLFIPVILVMTSQGVAMPFFSKQEQQFVICSPIEGVITYKGSPVSGAKVERWLKWKDEEGEREFVTTDAEGKFSFPVRNDSIDLSPITQFSAHQKIYVEHKGIKYQVWVMGKLGKGLYAELHGRPSNFRCELTDEIRRVETEGGLLGTSCKWDEVNTEIN